MSNNITGLPGSSTAAHTREGVVGVARDTNADGITDAVVVVKGGKTLFTMDGLEDAARFDYASQVLQSMGLTIDSDQAGEYIKALNPAVQQELASVASHMAGVLKVGDPGAMDGLQSRWTDFLSKASMQGGPMDVNALVQHVLRESYLETTQDLYFYAEKVKFFNGVKKAIRDELTNARNAMANYAGLKDTDAIPGYAAKGVATDYTGPSNEPPQMTTGAYQGEAVNTKAKLDGYIKGLEEKLSSVGDDAQLANVDLQNILQKQQQTIQLMSNISKMLHDTAMAIVRKMGG
jgi:hypothetical protein